MDTKENADNANSSATSDIKDTNVEKSKDSWAADSPSSSIGSCEPNIDGIKRPLIDEDEEIKRKKRKEDYLYTPRSKSGSVTAESPKPVLEIQETDDLAKTNVGSPGPKVPPLKIVIPPTTENEQTTRNGKSGNSRHHSLPYVVVSSDDSNITLTSSVTTTVSNLVTKTVATGDLGAVTSTEEQRAQQRVLRSNKSSSGRNSESSSPAVPDISPQESMSPTPAAPSATASDNGAVDEKGSSTSPTVTQTTPPPSSTSLVPGTSTSSSGDLHPRKRKIKTKEIADEFPPVPTKHPHEIPVTNCYQLYIDIRKHIEKKHRGLFPVQPKPPQGFKDYLMNRRTYILDENATQRMNRRNVTPPATVPTAMKKLYLQQEAERFKLKMQHLVQKEKLVLSVEQEILRVHGRAARALANQELPFSVCTLLKDEEVYSVITPEQEEKDKNARSRYNGRLFISWLQDVDDKWEKIKEEMLARHRMEADGLRSRQRMLWTWQMEDCALHRGPEAPIIPETHVPLINVSDDFDLIPE